MDNMIEEIGFTESNHVLVELRFDGWQHAVSSFARIEFNRLQVTDILSERIAIAFTRASTLMKLAHFVKRWFALSFGLPIPITKSEVECDESSRDSLVGVSITPGCPADFTVTLRCFDQHESHWLRRYFDRL